VGGTRECRIIREALSAHGLSLTEGRSSGSCITASGGGHDGIRVGREDGGVAAKQRYVKCSLCPAGGCPSRAQIGQSMHRPGVL